MQKRHLMCLISIQGILSYWITSRAVQMEKGFIILMIHYCVFILKLCLFKVRPTITDKSLIGLVFIESIYMGFISYCSISFIQTIGMVQLLVSFDHQQYYKESTMLIVVLLIPTIIHMESLVQVIENTVFSITTIIWIWYLWKAVTPPMPSTPNKHESININMSFRHKLLKQIPFFTDSSYIILDENLQIHHNSLRMDEIIEDPSDLNKSQTYLLQEFLESKPESFSKSFQKLFISNGEQTIFIIFYFYFRTQKKQNRSIRSICQLILSSVDSYMNYFYVGDIENKNLKLQNIKINIILFRDEDSSEDFLLLIIEQLLEKKTLHLRSIRTNTLNNINNQSSVQTGQDTIQTALLSNIFSSISHEFGTYLNCIVQHGEQGLTDDTIQQDVRDIFFSPITINAKLLQYILQNIRDFNSILLKTFSLRLQEFNPFEELEEVIQLIDQQLTSRKNQLIVKCSPNIIFYNDQERFKQIVYQLLSNAIRFTQNGVITVDVSLQKDTLRVSVCDTGIGMNEKEKQRLSDLLKDGRKLIKISQNSVGCGLGLSISNAIAVKMNGNKKGIQFHSSLQKGSTFIFSIQDSKHLYNESAYFSSYSQVKMVNDMFYVEPSPSEMGSFKMSQSIVKSHPLDNNVSVRLTKKSSSSKRKQSSETQNQFQARFSDVSNFYHMANQTQQLPYTPEQEEDESGSEHKLINVPSLETNFKTHVIKYQFTSTCCQRILAVDDEYFNIVTIKILLRKYQVKIDYCFNGYEALQICEAKSRLPCPRCKNTGYVLIFMDINMPVMDGFDSVREMKRRMSLNLMPRALIIANSGHADLETKQTAYRCGVDLYLSKPIRFSDLEDFIKLRFPDFQ